MADWREELARLLADLLEYPVEHPGRLRRQVEQAAARIRSLAPATPLPRQTDIRANMQADIQAPIQAVASLQQLLAALADKSLDDLRREYVRMFDILSDCGLYVACHRYGGNTFRQEEAQDELNALYRDTGFMVGGLNLPDYLPLMLEYLSLAPDWARQCVLNGYSGVMRALGGRLERQKNLYAPAGACLKALVLGFAQTGVSRPVTGLREQAQACGEPGREARTA